MTNTNEHPITFTPKALTAIQHILQNEGQPGDYLRVSIIGGGCAGYQYDLNFDKNKRSDDTEITYDNITILIDPISTVHLEGTTIDFVTGLNGNGFNFINPNAKRTCGCGSSWS